MMYDTVMAVTSLDQYASIPLKLLISFDIYVEGGGGGGCFELTFI